jgi:dolichyl-phosphooligosaccharide-protein glycotransferase
MIFKKIPTWVAVLVILAIIIAVALWLRMGLPHDQVFVKDWIKLTGIDTYYMMRLTDNLVAHFPKLTEFDPYNIFPDGARTDVEPNFFIYLMGGIVALLGGGKPDQHFTDLVSVYIPPVLAVITILGAFFVGKALKNAWTGLLAAGLLAIMPGEFLNRSLLGYTDYHIAESMFTALLIAFVAFAVNNGSNLGPGRINETGWKPVIKPAVYSALAGLMLALYMLLWAGAALFVLIVFAFLVVQIIIDYARGWSTIPTGACGVVTFLIALIIYYPGGRSFFSFISVVGAIALTAVLTAIAVLMARRRIKAGYFILSIAACGAAGLGLMYILLPGMLATMFDNLFRIFNWNIGTTIMEMQPLLLQQGQLSLAVPFGNYTSGLLLGMAGLALVIYHEIKQPSPTKLLLIIWSLLILLSALAMRRFAYYFAVNIAVLSGYFAWWVLELAGFGKKPATADVKQETMRKKAGRIRIAKTRKSAQTSPALMSVALAVVLLVMVYPNLGPMPGGGKASEDLATRPLFAPSDAWCESLDWLRVNTPEPLGDPAAYYKLYKEPGKPDGYVYPRNAYGVLAWWDYGYWITRIGRRIPFSNPGTSGINGEARFFLAQDEAGAVQFLKDINIRYVIVDDEIASYESKFFALPTWVGGSYQDYYDVYLQKQGENYTPTLLFYPEYYRSMVTRLYNFGGKQVIPTEVNVIGYETVTATDGKKYRAITEVKAFGSYPEATQYLAGQQAGTHRIVGRDPYICPVPLEALNKFKPAYDSSQTKKDGPATVPFIRIFEYLP